MTTPIPVIFDCDPGIDDAIALLGAFAAPELDIRAILAVCGNQPLERTLRNALQICELGGREDIPVHAGAHRPLCRDPIHGKFHGENGLGDTLLPDPLKRPEPVGAVEALIDHLGQAARSAGPKITLCCLGPLTDLALALRLAPDIAAGIERVVMMGGAFREPGNRSLTSEFNMLADPHAAAIVFAAGLPMTVLGLDATHQVMLRPEHVASFAAVSGRISRSVAGLMAFWDRNDPQRYGSRGGPLHDPLVTAFLLAPELFETRPARVFVETESPLCLGQTVADWFGKTGAPANADIAIGVDAGGVIELYLELLARYGTGAAA
ncbi:nucleoside hydrolase [Rhodovulum sulfidophilum]|uniref:Inosine/uridine-preferring nucleoside hydrolase n=1 Tax=Rhodovulum sulfidophilum TaxID=35806 RepID=A0A0D6AYI6_RHOSU|nr:nucleoside hydrolase [Rhodovulum sulfidophilum]ANB33700.1 nucleoside hydrolase [Rhodovulum sulfidophilum DSM 1374]ANB37521.1 nucleoside hydrolase [Rhodovulum sulfidophilum]MBL3554077.1 nucleoside hydrolase [Rhodovulum sulfidophilum]MBL3561806.1 nucleoside hydrolase [Rhodovulum sulfidophilum]MBL3564405.1 nucleoside hydrolase [Rhodovulum sulfidophilum]